MSAGGVLLIVLAIVLAIAAAACFAAACSATDFVNHRHATSSWFMLACLVLVVLAVVSIGGAFAQGGGHGVGHAENHDWYKDLKQPGGSASCCSKLTDKGEGDCRPVRAWLHDDGWWRAIVEGRPVRVPPSKVLEHSAPDGNAHLCMSPAGTVYCFLAPQPKS